VSRSTAAVACAGAILVQTAWMGPAAVGLDVGLALSFAVWVTRPTSADAAILPIYLVGIFVQCLHFGEELVTGFARAFPAFFGYAWSDARFVAFNVTWLVIFGLAALGVRRGVPAAFLVVWFFALVVGIGNGIMHMAVAAMRGAYFPGLVTAPAHFVVGVLLVRRLAR
jgi:hypothetical protein